MSSAAAATDAAPAKGGSKKKLFIIIGAVVLLLVLAGGGALFMMSKQAASADEEGGEAHAEVDKPKAKEKEHGAPPTFVPLDLFTVNLADTQQDRYLQIGMQLELADAHAGDQIKAYMPAIRNAVLLILSRKTSEELLTAEGKAQLAAEIRTGAARAMGLDVEDESADAAAAEEDAAPKKKKKKKSHDENPIVAVHYANFIIQ
ncbi:MAG: flagellar basal body-associated FliL family protein [Burkholderiales bacterium]|nr:flagellar basal body-associated FliL family protein [Burkholderiales bacterium]